MTMENKLNLSTSTDELKRLIEKNPELPIVVVVDSEIVTDDSYYSWFAPHVSYSIGEILNVEQPFDEEHIFTDRDEFYENVFDTCEYSAEAVDMSDQAFDEYVNKKVQEYDPYWEKVIIIHATT